MPKKEYNSNCPCTYNCPRHGNCTECREYHSISGTPTYCTMHTEKK